VSILDPAAVMAALEVPEDWAFIGYFCLGYPAEQNDAPELERCGWEHRRPAAAARMRR
jgi:5,6-dimethylbenzimidazole synthase